MIIYILLFLIGLCIGSFLNAVIFRLETGESIIAEPRGIVRGTTRKFSRSYCPHCKTTLRWHDLIPVLSFLLLRGRCRYCKRPISWQYPIVEIATGLIFILIINFPAFAQGFGGQAIFNKVSSFKFQVSSLIFWFYIASSLIVIFIYDFKHYIIPDKILFPAIAVSIMYHVLSIMYGQNYTPYIIQNTLYNYAGSALAASGFFLILVLVSRGKWMGLGDVKLAFLMGLILGWPNIAVALFLAFMSGAVVGTILILAGFIARGGEQFSAEENCSPPDGRYTLKSQIPFGPFLILGTFAALFWGQKIIEWYLGMWF